MKKLNSGGFGAVEALLIVVIVGVVCGVGYLVYHSQKNTNKTLDSAAKSQSEPEVAEKKQENKFLEIKEVGIKLKLTSNIEDAYYFTKVDNQNRPIVFLSTHSLDKYVACTASKESSGVALISTFKAGETDPVHGDYSTTYPDAPKIEDLYYFIDGNHDDCTLQQDNEKYRNVRKEFIDAGKTIEKL